jgi:hypothetical protein
MKKGRGRVKREAGKERLESKKTEKEKREVKLDEETVEPRDSWKEKQKH